MDFNVWNLLPEAPLTYNNYQSNQPYSKSSKEKDNYVQSQVNIAIQAKKHIIHEFLRYYLTWANINCLYYWMPGKVYRTIHTFLLFTKDCMFSMVLFVMYACVCVFSCFGCSKCCLCWSKNKAPGEEPPSTCYVWRTIVPWCCLGKAKVKPEGATGMQCHLCLLFWSMPKRNSRLKRGGDSWHRLGKHR